MAIAEAQTVTDSPFVSINGMGRENLALQFGIGLNSFNSYVGERNVSVELLNLAREYSDTIKLAMVDASSESVFYITKGKGGLQGGNCELFRFDIEGKEREVLRHQQGGYFVFADMIRGLRVIRQGEVIELAAKGNDLRKFKVIERESGKEHLYAGALIGHMNEKRQALCVATGNSKSPLALVCLTTGRIGAQEKADRAVEIGSLNDADKATLRAQIFDGIIKGRLRDDERNHARKTRKALRDSAKAALTK